MKQYSASNLKAGGTKITLDVDGTSMTADFAKWEELIKLIGGTENVDKVTLLGKDTLEFPNDVHVEVEDFVELAKQQNLEVSATMHKTLKKALQEVVKVNRSRSKRSC